MRHPLRYLCPICNEPSVRPHPDSLCRSHRPAEPFDEANATIPNRPDRDASLDEAEAVAGAEFLPRDRWQTRWTLVDWLWAVRRQANEESEADDFLAAAMGDPEAAAQFPRPSRPRRRSSSSPDMTTTGMTPLANVTPSSGRTSDRSRS